MINQLFPGPCWNLAVEEWPWRRHRNKVTFAPWPHQDQEVTAFLGAVWWGVRDLGPPKTEMIVSCRKRELNVPKLGVLNMSHISLGFDGFRCLSSLRKQHRTTPTKKNVVDIFLETPTPTNLCLKQYIRRFAEALPCRFVHRPCINLATLVSKLQWVNKRSMWRYHELSPNWHR